MFYIDKEWNAILNAYASLMLHKDCELKRERRFRVLMFAYLFGCVRPEQVSLLYPDPDCIFLWEQEKKELHSNQAFLNYLSVKNAYLTKLNDGAYHISPNGLRTLAQYLIGQGFLSANHEEYFLKHAALHIMNTFHASSCGASVHLFSSTFHSPFLCEAAYGYNGEMLSLTRPYKTYEVAIIPDAVTLLPITGENVFIEEDCCTERIYTALVPKFQSYSYLLDAPEKTIHFFIDWKEKKEEKGGPYYPSAQIHYLKGLYDFISSTHEQTSYSFQAFLRHVRYYEGRMESIIESRHFLSYIGPDVLNSSSISSLQDYVAHYYKNTSFYSKKYIKRKNAITSAASRQPKIMECLENGLRLLFSPQIACGMDFPFLYLHPFLSEQKIAYELCRLFLLEEIPVFSSYKAVDVVSDERTGEIFSFRNRYLFRSGNDFITVFFENISDDFGGFIRVKKLLENARKITAKNTYVFAVFNTSFELDLFEKTIENYKKIGGSIVVKLLSYNDLEMKFLY